MPMDFRLMRPLPDSASGPTEPEPPTGLSLYAYATSGNGAIQATWTAGANGGSAITNYQVAYSTDGGSTFPTTVTTNSTSTTYTKTDLAIATEYHVRVRAQNAVGYSDWSATAGPVTTPDVPEAIGEVVANTSTTTESAVDLSWSAPADGGSLIVQYRIYYSYDSGTTWTEAGVTGSASYELIIPYRGATTPAVEVKAENNAGLSDASPTIYPTLSYSPPSVVQNFSVTRTFGADANLSWTAPQYDGGPGIGEYEIEVDIDLSVSAFTSGITSDAYDGNTADIGKTAQFRVRAVNTVGSGGGYPGKGEWSDWQSVTLADVPDSFNFFYAATAASGEGAVDLTLYPVADNGAPLLSYDLEYADNSGFSSSTTQNYTDIDTSGYFYNTITGLVGGQTYYFRVRFNNELGAGAYSNEPSASASPTVPSQITDFAVTPDYTQSQGVTGTWSTPYDGGSSLTGLEIADDSDNIIEYPTWSDTTDSWYVATAGVEYSYKIRAINSVGNGPWSPLASVMWKEVPATPANVTATDQGGGNVEVSWDEPTNPSAAGPFTYTVSYSDNSWSTQTDFPGVTSPYVLTGLSGYYDIRVTVQGDNFSGDPIYADTNITV